MLEKPQIADAAIIEKLEAGYAIVASGLEFLPVGNDARAWSFRVETSAGDYFLKMRKGAPSRASLLVPHYLKRRGIRHVVAPIATVAGDLAVSLGEYALIMYPFVEGRSDWAMALSRAQWRAWGAIMRRIHDTSCDEDLLKDVPAERFAEKWLSRIEDVEAILAQGGYIGEVAAAVAAVWCQNSHEIEMARERYLALGAELAAKSPPYALCHADIHRANIIIAEDGSIHIVDWDETVLAPKERDLMFFLGDGHAREDEAAFLQGYGACRVDATALAYFRYDWVLQELADYGERVFLASDVSERDLAFARDEFARLFAAGDVVERAQQAYARLREAGETGSSLA